MSRVLIGIDPGKETGIAIMRDGDLLVLETCSFFDVLSFLEGWGLEPKTDVQVYIEDPNLNKPVFDRGQRGRIALNIAQKVGANKRDAELLIEYCNRIGIPVFPVRPQSGPFTKMTAEFFKKQTGWTGRTSQHARDAYSMIIGRG